MKKKLLVVHSELKHYRVPLFDFLQNHFDVTVVDSGSSFSDLNFQRKPLSKCSFFGLNFMKGFFVSCKSVNPDIILLPDHLRWPQFILLRFLMFRKHFVWFAFEKNKSRILTLLKTHLVMLLRDPIVVYNDGQFNLFLSYGIPERKIFNIRNTVHGYDHLKLSDTRKIKTEKDIFINVGSLHKRKRNDVLISAVAKLRDRLRTANLKVVLIGNGTEKENLERYARTLTVDVEFVSEITDPEKLLYYYRQAIASVSFGQSGLSVLQSIAAGVPFVTSKNAISGGEIENVIDGVTGYLVNDEDDLVSHLEGLVADKSLQERLRGDCVQYFQNSTSFKQMASTVMHALGNQI
jgi:glycosyltransferase involved in cell wall biosynthesis